MGCDAYLFNYTEKFSIFLGRWHYYNTIESTNLVCKELNQKQVIDIFNNIAVGFKGIKGMGPIRQFLINLVKEIKKQDKNSKYIILHDYLPEIPYSYCFKLFDNFKHIDI
jgi:hypothetical protein